MVIRRSLFCNYYALCGQGVLLLLQIGRLFGGVVLDVEIVTPTYCGFDSLFSINYIEPAYVTGLDFLRQTYSDLNVTHRVLLDSNGTLSNCIVQASNVQDTLARWYYQERRSTALPVILTPGTFALQHNSFGLLIQRWL